ncbi:MAG: EAL domain-containing protein [Cyanobacteria bacterium P01_G01_bin.19]
MEFIKTNRGKVIFTTLLGIQIPLFALVYYLLLSTIFLPEDTLTKFSAEIPLIVSATLFIDILVTAIASYTIFLLLSPVTLTSNTLSKYLEELQSNRADKLPTDLINNANAIVADNSQTLDKLDSVIQYLVDYDTLTGLPNRKLFQTYIHQAISETASHQQFALIVLDLNSLKNINSTLGRHIGDLLLNQVARRLSNYLSTDDILARFGGDEFAILRTNITDCDSSIALSNDLLESLLQPFLLHGEQIHCDAKIGITVYPFDGVTVEQLLQNADTAIYQAKQEKLNTYQFYSHNTSTKLKRTLAIKENLRYALKKNEFSICYQPRIEISTGYLVGVEALLRWNNPELGWVSPKEFIPIAEETSLIMPIGEWVLRNACLQHKQWQEANLSHLRMSVNLSVCQFKQPNLVETINCILNETGMKANCLELEITESILVEDIERAISILWELKRKGISIALDDFGTGYSSFSYIQKLPIDTLKIDRSFVTNIASNPDDVAIAKAIIALAQSLELKITAEGVETQAQLEYLQNQGCNEVQGYYFAKPLSGKILQDFILNYNALADQTGNTSTR